MTNEQLMKELASMRKDYRELARKIDNIMVEMHQQSTDHIDLLQGAVDDMIIDSLDDAESEVNN